jgi:hypothetical protein
MEYLKDSTQRLEETQRAGALVALAVARDTRLCADAGDEMRSRGFARFLRTKDVNGDLLVSTDPGVAEAPMRAAFLAQVGQQSILGRLTGAVRIPFNESARLQVGSIAASVVAEGAVKPIARMAFDVSGPPSKVICQVVVTAEMLRSVDPATQAGITAALESATAAGLDDLLVSVLTAGSVAAGAEPGILLQAISGGRPSKPVLIGGYDVLLSLPGGVLRDLGALGIPVLPCAAASGFLVALDQTGLLIAGGDIIISTARYADIDVDFGGSPADVRTLNLWTSNLAVLRAEAFVKLAIRSGASAWASTGSPA